MENNPAEKKFRSGMVSIVGRPNVGKSTLLNNILGEKIAIVSAVPQTTRFPIRGIYNDERGQIVFIDTPGIHVNRDALDKFMNKTASDAIDHVDGIIYLVDTQERVGTDEETIARRLKDIKAPIILGLNKVDLKGMCIPDYIALWERVKGMPVNDMKNFTLLPLSGTKGIHVEKLLDILFDYLPEGPVLYPQDIVSDAPQKMVLADLIREKFFNIMRQEVPHSLAVMIERMESRSGKATYVQALIFIERESQKSIVIGNKGEVLKEVGTLARREMEDLLGTKVFLEMFVKVKPGWRDDALTLGEMGYGG